MKLATPLPKSPFEFESTSSNPNYSGFIEIRINPSGPELRWLGEEEWASIEWWEVLAVLRHPLKESMDSIEEMRDIAKSEGYTEGLALAKAQAEWESKVPGSLAKGKRLEMKLQETTKPLFGEESQ